MFYLVTHSIHFLLMVILVSEGKEGNVLFNNILNTLLMVIIVSERKEGRKCFI